MSATEFEVRCEWLLAVSGQPCRVIARLEGHQLQAVVMGNINSRAEDLLRCYVGPQIQITHICDFTGILMTGEIR